MQLWFVVFQELAEKQNLPFFDAFAIYCIGLILHYTSTIHCAHSNDYSLKDFSEFYSFLQYCPQELDCKWNFLADISVRREIIVFDAFSGYDEF